MDSEERDSILDSLGITFEFAKKIRIGLSDRTLGLQIPGRRWKAGLLIRSRLLEFGILRESGHEEFRGCAVVPIIMGGQVRSIYGRRLDRSRIELWASGLPGTLFEIVGSSDGTRALVTNSVPSGICLASAIDCSNGEESPFLVFAPGSAKGFEKRAAKELAKRFEHVTVFGRDGAILAEQFQRLGLLVSIAGEEFDVVKTIIDSTDARGVVDAWLGSAVSFVKVDAQVPDEEQNPLEVAKPITTVTPGRDEAFVVSGPRSWRIRGAMTRSNVEGDRLSVGLSVSDRTSGRFHLDTLDLYTARLRRQFLDTAATELRVDREVLNAEMAEVLFCAEARRDGGLDDALTSVEMSGSERELAMRWLENPDLFVQLQSDLSSLGVVGEATNLLLCYLATISRKCERPLGVVVQASSAGGKSTLVDAICSLVPREDLVSLSAITSQALYYLGGTGLQYKVLSVAEERGALRATYPLKLLLSEGRIAIASTGKDQATGRLMTKNYETSGPVAVLMTTTAASIDPELENRLIVIGVSEEREQTEAIISAQIRGVSLEGILARHDKGELSSLHANIQRLLVPMTVVIGNFDHEFPSTSTRHRRDHAKLLSIISSVALLHQFQRERHTTSLGESNITYIEATEEDIACGLALAEALTARSEDSLSPQASRLLEVIRVETRKVNGDRFTLEEVQFTRRQLRELLGWTVTQVRAACDSLVAMEYLRVSGSGRGRSRTYRLLDDLKPSESAVNSESVSEAIGEASKLVKLVGLTVGIDDEGMQSDSYMTIPGETP